MIKKVLKETGIIILFLFAEALLLGVLFYGYIPAEITIPTKVVPYQLSADISNELNAGAIARRKYNKNISNRCRRFKII